MRIYESRTETLRFDQSSWESLKTSKTVSLQFQVTESRHPESARAQKSQRELMRVDESSRESMRVLRVAESSRESSRVHDSRSENSPESETIRFGQTSGP